MTSAHRTTPLRRTLGLVLGVALGVAACEGAAREGDRADARSPSVSSDPSTSERSTDASPATGGSQPTSSSTTTTTTAAPPEMPQGTPARIVIPSIGVDAPVVDLNRNTDGTLQVPGWSDAGGWQRGPEPGERGPAVIVGHVDSRAGPAVFYELDRLRAGDRITIELDDRRTTSYVVERSERFPKAAFPTRDVYQLTTGPELRLITCDGEFDRTTGHYVDNLVVFATPS